MRFYTSVNRQGSVICHRYIEDGKRHSEIIKDYNYDLYIKSEYSKDAVGIHKEHLKKYEFETVVEMGEFVKSNGKYNVYGNTDPVAQFIAKEYPKPMSLTNHYVTLNFDIEVVHASGKIKYKDYHELKVLLNDEEHLMSLGEYRKIDLSKNTALVYDIEKEQYLEFVDSCYAPLSIGFPDPNLALYEIMTISVISSLEDKIYVFGTKEFTGEVSIPNSKYTIVHIECGSEKELLIRFIQKWRDINPDVVTGWNCIPLTNTIWKSDRIVSAEKILLKDKLYDSHVECVFPRSYKEQLDMVLENGTTTHSSKDHVYPIYRKPKDAYLCNFDTLIQSDSTVNEIKDIMVDDDVYLKLNLNNNMNQDLTYRKLFVENYEYLKDKGVIFKIQDTNVVKKMSMKLGYATKETDHSLNMWGHENVESVLGIKEVMNYLKRADVIRVYHKDLNQGGMSINMNAAIDDELLWLMGMWFTDGTSTYKTEVSICNKNPLLNIKCKERLDRLLRNKACDGYVDKHGCTIHRFGLSKCWLYKLFMYDGVLDGHKSLDITLLSQLSYSQFMNFISGCIDGDGHVFVDSGAISIANYMDQSKKLSELLLWNGVFNTCSKNSVYFYLNDEKINSIIESDHKRKSINNDSNLNNVSKSKNIRWFMHDGDYYVRIKDVKYTGEFVDMMDISTNTHYFVSNGVTTHNCNGFDVPYLINRIVRVLGKKIASKLSPFSESVANCIKERQTDDAVLYQILGVTVYDYLELYKKFNRTKQESYKLDYIGEVEVGHSKVSFDEYDNSLMKLWEYDYNKFILYNAIDTLIVNKLDEKLKFISLAITIAHLTKSDLNDATGTVKIWDNLIYNLLLNKNIQIPPKTHNDEDVDIIGAYVKEPLYGRHGWVLTSDATSLYPMLIRMFNMSPETLVHREVGNSISTKDKRVIETLDDNLSYVDGMIRLQDEYGISEDIISFDVYDEDLDVDSLEVLSKRGLMKLKDHINNEIKFYGSGHEFIKGVDNVLDNIELTLNMQNDLSFAKELNVAVAGNGSTYDKSEIGVIPEGMTFLFDYRKSLKTEMNEKKKIIQSKIAELAELEAN